MLTSLNSTSNRGVKFGGGGGNSEVILTVATYCD